MKYTYCITVGDWSYDGHNQTQDFIFNSSHNADDIIKAYDKAVEKIGYSLHHYDKPKSATSLCVEYEDNKISLDIAKKFLDILKLSFTDLGFEYYEEDETYHMSPDDIAILYLWMVHSQLPDFIWEDAKLTVVTRGIGYGCFQ